MDQITLDKLKAAGFDDNDIAEYAKEHTADNGPVSPTQVQTNEMPSVPFDPNNVPNTIAPPNTTTQNAGEGLMGVGKVLEHPVTHLIEGGLGGAYAVNKIANALASRGATPPTSAPVAPAPAPVTPEIKPVSLPPGNPMNAGFTPQPPAQPPVGGPAAQQGSNFIENIAQKYSQIAQKFAPTMQGIAESPLGRVAGGAMRIAGSTPVMGAQLALHSGGLNTNEDQLLADKHRLEAQMLLNKHAAEWSKYQKAKQTVQGQQ